MTGESDYLRVLQMDGTYHCGKPSAPWSCSREPKHPGPCAATRDPKVSFEPKHVQCAEYTAFHAVLGFYKEQQDAINEWMKSHDHERHIRPGQTARYSGAIGGAYTYEFTPTSLGIVSKVRCACGEELDVTNYDEW